MSLIVLDITLLFFCYGENYWHQDQVRCFRTDHPIVSFTRRLNRRD